MLCMAMAKRCIAWVLIGKAKVKQRDGTLIRVLCNSMTYHHCDNNSDIAVPHSIAMVWQCKAMVVESGAKALVCLAMYCNEERVYQ